MTQNPAITPPVETIAQATPPIWVGLHTGDIAINWTMAEFLPLDKPMAAWLVSRILTLSLAQDLLLDDPAVCIFGTLGDGMALIATSDPARTVQALKRELETMGMLPLAQIGIGCPSAWQCVHPGPHVNLGPLLDLERFAEINRQFANKLLAIKAALFRQAGPSGDCPPPAAK